MSSKQFYSRGMKIAFYTPGWPPGSMPNGIVTYYGSLIPELCKLGHEVFIIAGRVSDCNYSLSNLTVIEAKHTFGRFEKLFVKTGDLISPGYWVYRAGAQAIIDGLNSLLEENEIDILEMEESFGWSDLVAEALNIPIVVRLHGPHFLVGIIGAKNSFKSNIQNRINREGHAFNKALYVTSPSQDVMDKTKKYYDVDWPLSKVIPNSVSSISPKQRWSVTDCDRQGILFVGRFDYLKGGDLAIDAFVQLAEQHPDACLTFVGPDHGITTENGGQIGINEYLETKVPNSIRRRINYRGFLAKTEIEILRRKAFLTVCCSRYESFGNVLLEALAFGCPLIATDVGGCGEIVRDGYNGLLVAPNADDIAEHMRALLDDPVRAQKLSDNAVGDCKERFEPKKVALNTVSFYKDVCAHHGKKQGL